MTSAVNVRSQLILGICIFISLIVQCDATTGSGKLLDDEDFHSNLHTDISNFNTIWPTQVIVILIIKIIISSACGFVFAGLKNKIISTTTQMARLRPNVHIMVYRWARIQSVGTWLTWLSKNRYFFHANDCILTKISLSITFHSLCLFRFLPLPNPQMAMSSLCEYRNSSQFTYR